MHYSCGQIYRHPYLLFHWYCGNRACKATYLRFPWWRWSCFLKSSRPSDTDKSVNKASIGSGTVLSPVCICWSFIFRGGCRRRHVHLPKTMPNPDTSCLCLKHSFQHILVDIKTTQSEEMVSPVKDAIIIAHIIRYWGYSCLIVIFNQQFYLRFVRSAFTTYNFLNYILQSVYGYSNLPIFSLMYTQTEYEECGLTLLLR